MLGERLSPTSIQVNWTTDRPTIGMAVACTDAQFAAVGMTNGAYNVFSPIENLTPTTYATTHSAVITGLQPNHTIHFNVLVKDLIGNFAYFSDHTIAPAMSADGDFIIGGAGSLVTAYGEWTFGAGIRAKPRLGWRAVSPGSAKWAEGRPAHPACSAAGKSLSYSTAATYMG